MLHEDYLMRMFLMMASSIRESMEKARGGEDPQAAADRLDSTLEGATDFDGSLLLQMTPESMAAMMKLSNPNPAVMGYVARALMLSSRYLRQAGQGVQADLRAGQAEAVSQAFGLGITEEDLDPEALEGFFEETVEAEKGK